MGFSRPGNPWNRSAADCSSGLQCSIPISVDFDPKTDHPGVFGHYYYSVFARTIIIWPVKRCHIGIFHIGKCHLDIADTVDIVDTADIVHTVDTLDNVKSANSVDNVSSANSAHNVDNVATSK